MIHRINSLFQLSFFACVFFANSGFAQDVVISTNTTWASGTHTCDTLLVESGAILTLESDYLTGTGCTIQATTVTVESGAAISANGEGYPTNEGPSQGTLTSGAGHGGRGGMGDTGVPGEPFGSAATPSTLGSGSENGGAGGGAIRLDISGTLHVNGDISAHGLQPASHNGGGAGGSIWVTTQNLTGSGSILAHGGAPGATGYFGKRGGGGGGRIAVFRDSSTFSGNIEARGGDDGLGTVGEDGTVASFDTGTPGQVHLMTGHGYRFEAEDATAGEIAYDSISLSGSAVTVDSGVLHISATQSFSMTPDTNPSTLSIFDSQGNLSISSASMTIDTGCTVDVNGKGFQSGEGPCTGTLISGAGHGGRGGQGDTGEPGGVYGSAVEPETWGCGAVDGGAGGGALFLEILGTLQIDGNLQSHGTQVSTVNGGGAGGSILIRAQTVNGMGSITAHGGAPGSTGYPGQRGGGGGGRIAVYYENLPFAGSIEARGGSDGWGVAGEDGTVAFFDTGTPGQLHLNTGHGFRFEAVDATSGEIVFDSINFLGSAVTVDPGVQHIVATQAFTMTQDTSPSTLSIFGSQGNLSITSGSMTIGTNCTVHVNGKGFQSGEGPCTGTLISGAGHGGRGGQGNTGEPGGIFGSAVEPETWGSGAVDGGAGGGAILLEILGTLQIDGNLQSHGTQVTTQNGGGAGGSILVRAQTVNGTGSITAQGGAPGATGYFGQRGGGGGGRIAVHCGTWNFSGTALANGGADSWGVAGEDGTVGFFIGSNPNSVDLLAGHSWRFQINDATRGVLSYRNIHLIDSRATVEAGVSEIRAEEDFILTASGDVSHLTIFDDLGMMRVNAGNINVGSQCSINVDGKGYRPGQGPGTTTFAGGGGYGGQGGDSYQGEGGTTYGSAFEPKDLGSGGGGVAISGGGVLRLSATHTLTVDGSVSANGQAANIDGGGGSGGSVWLSAMDVEGNGVIEANGARGGNYFYHGTRGGGGGGRIAIYYGNNSFAGEVQAAGGPDNWNSPSGEDGSVTWTREIPIEIEDSMVVSSPAFSFDGFRLDWSETTLQTVLIRVTPLSTIATSWSLRGGFGAMPDTGEETWIAKGPTADASPAYEMIVPLDREGSYYFSVFNAAASESYRDYRIECVAIDRYVSNLPLGSISNRGTTTKVLHGAGFEEGMTVELRSATGVIDTDIPEGWSATQVTVSFYPYDILPQTADVAVIWPDTFEVTLEDCIEIVEGSQGNLDVGLSMPEVMRPLRTYTLWIHVHNTGNSNVRSPILRVTSQQNLGMRVHPEDPFERGPLLVLGAPEQAPLDIISPGTRFRFPIQYLAEGGAHAPIDFSVDMMDTNDQGSIWDPLKDGARPDHFPEDAWDKIWDNFTSQVGDSWGSFRRHMSDNAQYLFDHHVVSRDVRRLMYLTFANACAHTGISGPHAVATDAYAATPGVPLAFSRQNNNTINSRYQDGSLGFGWNHSFMSHLEVDGDIATVHLPGGYTKRYIRSAKGEWQSEHDDFGRLSQIAGGYEIASFGYIFHIFDGTGRLVEIRDHNDNLVTLTYTGEDLTQMTHSNGDVFLLGYIDGKITSLTDHAGRQTQYLYDQGKLSTVIAPNLAETHYTYTSENAVESVTYPDGSQVLFTYDASGRMATRAFAGDEQRLTYTYPDIGQVTLENDLGAAYAYVFGPSGETLQFTGPDQGIADVDWNGRGQMTRFEEPDGSSFSRAYDAAGNMVEFMLPDGNRTLLGWETQQSRLRWVRDARWGSLDFSYDEDGNMTDSTFPDGSNWHCEYAGNGRISQASNRRGESIVLTHDASGAITERQVVAGETFSVTRDAAHRPTVITGSVSGTTSVTYNTRDQITSVSYPNGHALSFDYDVAGRRTRMTFDDGYQVNYIYDAVGRLGEIQDQNSQMIIGYTYDVAGDLVSETRRNGTSSQYAYDLNGWMTSVTHYAPDDTVLESLSYTYDEVGQVIEVISSSGLTEYSYDEVGNLVEAEYPDGGIEHYTYDAVGNRVTETTNAGTQIYISNSMNQYTQVGGEVNEYDADGNLISDDANTYAFNTENHLVSVNASGPSPSTYTYDASMNLAEWTHDGTSTTFLSDPCGFPQVVAEYDQSDQLVARYVYGLGLTARVDAGGDLHFYNHDQQGHTRLMTDQTGAVVNRYEYTAFGLDRGSVQNLDQPFRFSGAYGLLTDELGIVHTLARTYSPSLGRFCSPDPISIAGGINLYAYAKNDPINLADPTGFAPTMLQAGTEFFGEGNSYYSSNKQNATLLKESYRLARDIVNNAGSILTGGVSLSVDPVEWGLGYAQDKATGWAADQNFDRNIDGVVTYHTGSGGKNGSNGPGASTGTNNPTGNVKPGGGQSPGSNPGGVQLNPAIITGAVFTSGPGTGGSIVIPGDPNEKVGPIGNGPDHYMWKNSLFHYTIYFENVPTASAPAQEVFVTDTLDPNLDWSTFAITDIAWGETMIDVPPESPAFHAQAIVSDYRENGQSLLVDMDVTLDGDTGEVSWTFRSLDPLTLDLPEDALAGFLPPNDDSGRGEGHVSFSIRPQIDVVDETVITNFARIVFDTQPHIDTNEVFNTIGVWIHPDLKAVLDQWRFGDLCGTSQPSILEFVQFVDDDYICP